jgi:hypothetical protein
MAQLLHQGAVRINEETLRYTLPNGERIYQNPDESLADSVNRMRPQVQRTVQFATVGKQVDEFYKKTSGRSYLQYSLSDEEDDEEEYDYQYDEATDYEDDNDEFESGHWKHRLQERKKYSSYSAAIEAYDEDDEIAYSAYPAECTDRGKTTRQARDAAMNNPIKKAQLDGVYMPPKWFTRSTEKLPETVPTPPKPTMST